MRQSVLTRLRGDRIVVGLSLMVVAALEACALLAPILPLANPLAQDLANTLALPDTAHPLGTDSLGRDVLSRIIWGSRYSLLAGLVPVALALTVGTVAGLISGYLGGPIDRVFVFVADFLFSLPYFVIALIIVAILGPDLVNALIAIAIGLVPSFIRLTRASVLGLKNSPFVLACRAMGMGTPRILFVHVLPNIVSPLMVFATIKVGESILAVAALSFLGLGAQPPTPEWGLMLNSARELILSAPEAVFYPSLALTITVLAVNLLADALRDRLDPKYQF